MALVMDAVEPNWISLIIFASVWAVGCAGFFYLIGILPLSAAPADVRSGSGLALVLANAGLVGVLLLFSFLFALAELRWTSLVIAGGMVFLFSPFAVQDLPDRLKDNQTGLAIMIAFAIAALLGLYFAGGLESVRSMLA